MLSTCLTFFVIALHSGSVVTLTAKTPMVVAGGYNWVLQERMVVVPDGTRALVVRVAPEQFAGVVEVKVQDGSNRLVWLEATGLTALVPTLNNGPAVILAKPTGTSGRSPSETLRKDLSRPATQTARGRRPSFASYDAAMSNLIQQNLSSQSSGSSCSCASMPEALMTPY